MTVVILIQIVQVIYVMVKSMVSFCTARKKRKQAKIKAVLKLIRNKNKN